MSMHHSTSPSCPYVSIAYSAMEKVFSRTPRSYQSSIIAHILKMMSGEDPAEPVLMIQPTGSGKSTVPLTCSVVQGGVSIVVENTLALGSDQSSKISSIVNPGVKNIKSYQLDTFKAPSELKRLCDSILKHITSNSSTSIICFSSPETLVHSVTVNFIQQLISKSKLNFFCIDEIHLFLEFGISFRPSFLKLKNKIISLFFKEDKVSMTIPILLMTATFDFNMYCIIQKMLGIQLNSNNVFWAGPYNFRKRHIKIEMKYSQQVFKHTCDMVSKYCSNVDDNKVIIISSTASRAVDVRDKLDYWLDVKKTIPGDTVVVIGEQETETKFAYTTEFTNTYFGNGGELYSAHKLSPRFLLGTPGCIGAGLDCVFVNLVIRIGLPTRLSYKLLINDSCLCNLSFFFILDVT